VFARTTTFCVRPDLVDTGVVYVRDAVLPVLNGIRGCVGQSMLVDRALGRCIVTAAWQSRRVMHANTRRLQPWGEQASEMLGASMRTEEWEIAALHRAHPAYAGACARVTWIRVPPEHMDASVARYREVGLPSAQGGDGFCSASLFVDRGAGRLVSTVTYDSAEALERARWPLAAATAQAGGIAVAGLAEVAEEVEVGDVVDVAEFDLVLAHLHVPEQS
jgi:hypothetical protein